MELGTSGFPNYCAFLSPFSFVWVTTLASGCVPRGSLFLRVLITSQEKNDASFIAISSLQVGINLSMCLSLFSESKVHEGCFSHWRMLARGSAGTVSWWTFGLKWLFSRTCGDHLLWQGFFFFVVFFYGSFRSNLHLRGRETIFCYHSISLKFKNSWGYFSWFIKFTSFQRNLPADLSLPQRLGSQECAGPWMPSTWVHCFGLSLWSFMLEYLFLRVKERSGKRTGVLKWIFPVNFSLSGAKEKVVWLSQLKTKLFSAGKNHWWIL